MNNIEEAIEDIKNGKLVVLVDDEDRENEGDIVIAAEFATPEVINFMATYGRGLICLAMTSQNAERIALQPIKPENHNEPQYTAFTIPIDARKGVTTGISAYDRSSTIKMAISEDSKPEDFIRPGHVFPLISRNGGVLVRAGHTEGSVDLSRLAGLKPASVICEIMKDDGDMARLEDLLEFSNKHKIKIATIADLIRYRLSSEKLVNNVLKEKVTTEFGKFDVLVYESDVNKNHHVAFVKGDINPDDKVMVRVHTDCMISDVFGAVNSYSKAMINESMKIINDHGCGVLLYIRQESNPDILKHHIQMFSNIESEDKHSSYNKEDDKTKPELRNYGIGAQILKDLGVRKIRLLTNHPIKVKGLEGFGLKIVERIHIDIPEHVRDEKLVRAENENIDNFLSIVNEKG